MTIIDITGARGSDLFNQFTGLNEAGTAINLSGYSVRSKARFQYGSTGILLNLAPTIYSGTAGEAFVSGLINVFISGSQLTGIPITQARYDLEVYNTDRVTGLFAGKLSINPELTY